MATATEIHNEGFERALDRIRADADSAFDSGRRFERLMKQYFRVDPVYTDQFSDVWLWSEWVAEQLNFTARDLGIDLVAAVRDGRYCAIQCKFHAPDTRITKSALDSFIVASDRDPFTRRMVVDTGAAWGPNAERTIEGLKPPCQVLRFNDLADRPIDWPDLVLDEPEALEWCADKFDLRPHQRTAFDEVWKGFADHDRGRLIMACGTGKTFTALRIAEAVAGVGRDSGIVNDPNGWFDEPRDLITAIRRIVHVSVETVRVVARLPDPFVGEDRDQGEGQP